MSVAYRVVLRGPGQSVQLAQAARRIVLTIGAALTVLGPSKQRGTRRTFLGNFLIFFLCLNSKDRKETKTVQKNV